MATPLYARSGICASAARVAAACMLVLAVSGCATASQRETARKAAGKRYVVSALNAQFYKYGPAQAFGADLTLPKGTKVTMMKHEFGFSQIRLDDGESGYVATEDLRAAPPEAAPPSRNATARDRRPARSRSRPRGGHETPKLDLSDLPAPELPKP